MPTLKSLADVAKKQIRSTHGLDYRAIYPRILQTCSSS